MVFTIFWMLQHSETYIIVCPVHVYQKNCFLCHTMNGTRSFQGAWCYVCVHLRLDNSSLLHFGGSGPHSRSCLSSLHILASILLIKSCKICFSKFPTFFDICLFFFHFAITQFDCKFVAKHHGNNNELEQTSSIWSYCIVRSPLPQLYQRIMVSPWVVINTPWPLRSPSERLKVCRTCLFFCLAMSFY